MSPQKVLQRVPLGSRREFCIPVPNPNESRREPTISKFTARSDVPLTAGQTIPGGDPKNKEQQTWAWENEEKQWNDWSRSSSPLLSGSGAVALFLQNLRPFRREVESGRYRLPRNGAQSCASANVPNEFPQLCMRVVFSRRKASQPALSHRVLDPSQILFEG